MNLHWILRWSKPISDTEYIDRIRKALRLDRRLRCFCAIIALLTPLAAISCTFLVYNAFIEDDILSSGKPFTAWVFWTSVFLGFVSGFWIYQGVELVWSAFSSDRKSRLLVECWDKLHQAENDTNIGS